MSMALVFLVTMVLFETQAEVELPIWRSDFGWGLPISMRVWWRGGVCLAVMKRAASSNSAAEDMTNLMIWVKGGSGMLLAGISTSAEENM